MADTDQTYQSQSSIIIRSRYGFSRIEKNAIYSILSKIRKEFIDQPYDSEYFSDLKVSIEEKKLIDTGVEKTKDESIEGLVSLRHRDISIEREDGSSFNCGFINCVQYFPDSKSFEIVVPSLIIPYLVDLSKRFPNNYSLTVAITLKSKWSQKLYEICCQYKNYHIWKDPFFVLEYQELRDLLQIENEIYSRIIDFNRRVIEASQQEIKKAFDNNQSDLWFEYRMFNSEIGYKYLFIVHTN